MKKIKFGFSPCPNDTFILHALYNKHIDTEGYQFDWVIEDVEKLNKLALENAIDITKLSYGVYPKINENYQLLTAGSALGNACGPLVIYKHKPSDLKNCTIAIPGLNTTANFLLSSAFPEITNKTEVIFHEIESMLLDEKVDLGLIIHENRFTYQEKGLHLLRDLGEYWEENTQQPIPLGGFAVNRSYSDPIKSDLNKLIHESVLHAFAHPESGKKWIKSHAQEMSNEVINSHIELYVNEFSKDLGKNGKEAIQFMLSNGRFDEKKSNFILPIFVG